ncbi:MAG: helix-turn-helix transcriptional regulator [Ruminococcus sp.]|jgi:AraC-like DNA-binding protein
MGFSHDNHTVYVDNLEPLRTSIQNMLELHKITYGNELKRTAELLTLFAYVMDHSPDAKETQYEYSRTTYAEVAMRYLTSNYPRRIKISDLADYIGVDRSYLTKSFREQYHMSPQEYLISLRMDRALFLLENTLKSVTDIAYEVGYTDALAFSKAFKHRFGVSPSDHRAKVKK